MAKIKEEILNKDGGDGKDKNIRVINISTEMKNSYIDYAMSVITERALPDVRDGLKPVHRRILYAMHEMGLTSTSRFRKSAAVVGDVLGKYHPHGDSSVYEAMVKMAQEFSYRYPLVLGQGNFGSIDGDSAAAMRYTEAKMSRVSSQLLNDLDKDTVDWNPNYDGTRKEPKVLPAAVPNILLNGTLGIAVGMATSIPPHNLGEVVNACIHLIDNKDATTEDLMEFVKGPDFPLGGKVYGGKDMHHTYASGRGGILCRGEADIVETKGGMFQIVITSIPYRVNKAELIIHIADLVHEKKLEGIKGLRDESTKDIRIAIDLKQGVEPQKVLNYLFKHTELESTFHLNLVVLVDGTPQTLSLKSVLAEFIKHRQEVVRRRTEFELRKAQAREHILIGLKKALDHIDEIIKLIKASKDTPTAKENLMKKFKFSDLQATAILEMKLQKLAGLERKKIEDELLALQEYIKDLLEILGSMKRMMKIIKDEMLAVVEKYGDDRRTKIVKGDPKTITDEDLVPDEESILVFTKGGYVKRTNPDEYKKQHRGGVGVVDLNTKEEDFIQSFLTTNSHSDLLFFSDKGKAYEMKMYEIPEGKRATRGKSIMNYLALTQGENVNSILAMPKNVKDMELSIIMITKNGIVKKLSAESFKDVRRSGLIAIKLDEGDELLATLFAEKGDDVILVTSAGQSVRFKESDAREMGRVAMGVKAITLKKGDTLVCADVVKKSFEKPTLLVVSANGYGKQTAMKEYKVQKRGGSGIKCMDVTKKTGALISAKVVSGTEEEVIVISKNSQVIKTDIKSVPTLGRQTQGVRIMKLYEGDSIASLVCL
ncbi:MAG: DNA gyrase subunit A [Candidatus Parcubacteria bacterium]|nr:DNA gyrase subunit A [Candidatus Parcubacteria bacterium]